MKSVIVIHSLVTWALVGLIWTIQQVHYPLFSSVGLETYAMYQQEHMYRITLLVLPLMFIELVTAFILAFNPPDGINGMYLWGALGAVIAIWVTTGLINAPQHFQLSNTFDTQIHQALVQSNWIRTLLWTARGVFVGWVLFLLIE